MPTSAWEPDTCYTEQTMFNESQPDWWLGQHLIEEQQMKASQMYQSRYLRAADLDGETIVTIAKIGQVNLAKEGEAEDKKWAIRFKEFDKAMVLNKTNIKRLERACGTDEVEEWVGKQVTLFVDEVDFQGDLVQAIRIKAQPPAVAPKRVAGKPVGGQEMEDDIPW